MSVVDGIESATNLEGHGRSLSKIDSDRFPCRFAGRASQSHGRKNNTDIEIIKFKFNAIWRFGFAKLGAVIRGQAGSVIGNCTLPLISWWCGINRLVLGRRRR